MTALAARGADCWRRIGTWGDGSCPELAGAVHCRNCAVYGHAGRALLEQPPPADYLDEWAARLAAPPPAEPAATVSVVVFRLGDEELALPTAVFVEAVAARPVHRVPHRSGEVLLGLVNLRGELQLCVSLAALLGIAPAAAADSRPRLAVVEQAGARWVFPVDALRGVYRVDPAGLTAPPPTVGRDAAALTRALFALAAAPVALLDPGRLFARLREAVG